MNIGDKAKVLIEGSHAGMVGKIICKVKDTEEYEGITHTDYIVQFRYKKHGKVYWEWSFLERKELKKV